MTSHSDIPALASAFEPANEAMWRELAAKALKGENFERLVARTADDIAIQPLYQRAGAAGPRAFNATPGHWDIMARIDHPDPGVANEQAKTDLAGGADGLHLVFAGSAGAYGFGLAPTHADLRQALQDIDLARIAVEIDLTHVDGRVASELARLVVTSGLHPARARLSFGLDPVGGLMSAPGPISTAKADFACLSEQVEILTQMGFDSPCCVADGRIAHAAGASEAQELAVALAAALACLRALETAGWPLEKARKYIAFRLAADADQFLTIAKLRALRRLWARVEEACGLTPDPIQIHAETAWRMMTQRDPHVNILRATVAAFAAAVGGADRITVLPFTQALGLPDADARRLARNTQLILREEAHIARVADPAAGAGGFEALTEALAQEAWSLMQSIEAGGGLACARPLADLSTRVAAVQARRRKNFATRRDPLTGVSAFPDLRENKPAVLAARPAPTARPTLFPPVRNAEIFERLRDRADAAPQRPRVFLANFGPPSAYGARAAFARNLFEAGGIEAIETDGFDDPAAMGAAFQASQARLACICSSDDLYADHAAAYARALSAAGARMIYLAGRPGSNEAALRAAGVGAFAHAGCDSVALLEDALARAL